ncbi:PIN domain-containing protein [Paenarthrobacter ureafaciens]|uniref:PIN domain-containing protein n=1 Tax=Paenarthrobacter ureafaciens TaxID=37931 RepID=UPI0009AD0DD4|nr:PIN domain-containing protein [Paenarthrobacter ureafaciens]GLU58591.1 hypothetical protein Pure01_11040 [Paenarthrobacter ureafaciens]GLU61836.1 hypothetical protein Pure02_00860 [Paenarthrobacter ureafaciens]GLU66110.1 hypothetical protein Pure03_00860 [Paenarthrobacter ureafaciens]GLU71566.1 hypothetical protein Pure04_12810 [Paenarthrobacter ureafaciens]GLU74647.1 hypothetical protein Pure05_00870 [Paenarthrobacter ureafaciens]
MMEDNTLRDLFRGYYRPTDEEYRKIWDNGIIALDANVLLFLYYVQGKTANKHLDVLEQREDRLWIPHQVGLEFHRNVPTVRAEQTDAHQQRIKRIEALLGEIRSTPTKSRLTTTESETKAVEALETHVAELKADRDAIAEQTNNKATDELLERIASLFDGKVGPEPDQGTLDVLFKEGAKRFADSVPPGYEDAKTKTGSRKYGDYVLWKQLLDHATTQKRDVLFITDDNKEDWWLKVNGESVAPRPELIQEFRHQTKQDIWLLSSTQFYRQLFKETAGTGNQDEVRAAQREMEAVVAEGSVARTNLGAALANWTKAVEGQPTKGGTVHYGTIKMPPGASWLNKINTELRNQTIAMRNAIRSEMANTAAQVEFLTDKRRSVEFQLAASSSGSDRELLQREADETAARLSDAQIRLGMLQAQMSALDEQSDDD